MHHDVGDPVGVGVDHQPLEGPQPRAVSSEDVLADAKLPHNSVPLFSGALAGPSLASGRTSMRFFASSRRSWQTFK